MSPHMEDAASNACNDLVVLLALAEALERTVEESALAVDRTSPRVQDEDVLVSLAYAITNHAREAQEEIVARIAQHDAKGGAS